ncbi:MAG: DUF1624 domain-containing protein [Oscillospiraceae bacterium]|nr:DUF1624 domain-containing protein [Oscillospiraceae bacterium]
MTALSENRIQLMDGLRGFAVVLMVIHHFLFDLVVFLGAPSWLFENPVFNFLHYIFAGLFVVLSGVSSRFSRSNVKRGIKVLIVAYAMTAVTYYMGIPIRFGVLHLLGFSMVFYGLTARFLDKLPRSFAMLLYAALVIILTVLTSVITVKVRFLWMFGFIYDGFFSSDYFPIFPWLFVFLFGTVTGMYIKEHRFPEKFYTLRPPVFPAIGRHALLVYIVHQPVLYGVTYLIRLLSA